MDRNEISGIIKGIFIAFGLNIAAVISLVLLAGLLGQILGNLIGTPTIFAIAGIGIFQVLYIIPYGIMLKRQRQFAMMKGVIIGAVIVVLLNGACWLSVTSAYR
jgi:hypothetical protein